MKREIASARLARDRANALPPISEEQIESWLDADDRLIYRGEEATS